MHSQEQIRSAGQGVIKEILCSNMKRNHSLLALNGIRDDLITHMSWASAPFDAKQGELEYVFPSPRTQPFFPNEKLPVWVEALSVFNFTGNILLP